MSYKQWRITDPKILVTNPKILKIKVIKGLIINIRFFKNVIVMVFVLFFFFTWGSVVQTQSCLPHPELASSPPPDPLPPVGLRTCAVLPVLSHPPGKEGARRIHLGRSDMPVGVRDAERPLRHH